MEEPTRLPSATSSCVGVSCLQRSARALGSIPSAEVTVRMGSAAEALSGIAHFTCSRRNFQGGEMAHDFDPGYCGSAFQALIRDYPDDQVLSLIHISEPTR